MIMKHLRMQKHGKLLQDSAVPSCLQQLGMNGEYICVRDDLFASSFATQAWESLALEVTWPSPSVGVSIGESSAFADSAGWTALVEGKEKKCSAMTIPAADVNQILSSQVLAYLRLSNQIIPSTNPSLQRWIGSFR